VRVEFIADHEASASERSFTFTPSRTKCTPLFIDVHACSRTTLRGYAQVPRTARTTRTHVRVALSKRV